MKIYRVTAKGFISLSCYVSFIVRAKNENEALKLVQKFTLSDQDSEEDNFTNNCEVTEIDVDGNSEILHSAHNYF